jgi:hypothetical protein
VHGDLELHVGFFSASLSSVGHGSPFLRTSGREVRNNRELVPAAGRDRQILLKTRLADSR